MIAEILSIIHYYSDIDTRFNIEKIYKFQKSYKLRRDKLFISPLSIPEEYEYLLYYGCHDGYTINLDGIYELRYFVEDDIPGWVVDCRYGSYELNVKKNSWFRLG